MNKYITISLLASCLLLLLPIDLIGQRKVLGLPETMERPRDLYGNPSALRNQLYNRTSNKSKTEPWLVISDRDKNLVYDVPSTSGGVVRELNFRDIFFVVDEKEDWLEIAEAPNLNKLRSKGIVSIGWIPKDKLLLWKSGLVDYQTKINKKAFLLNKATDIKQVIELKKDYKELIVNFYKNPQGQVKESERTIYDYYFVFKKENGRMLLGEEAELSAYNVSTKLLGWVDERRIQEWNTRISLEPNFQIPAFEERKANSKYHFRAFGANKDVKGFVSSGQITNLFWDNDPVKFASATLAKSDPRRFKGNLVRFPMFKKGNYGGVDFFRSGVIGSINIYKNSNGDLVPMGSIQERKMAAIKEVVSELEYKNNNVNVFFVVEGTNNTYPFQQDMAQAIKSLRNHSLLNAATNVNYGALIYRDIPEGSRIIEYEKLTPDLDKISNFVAQADFINKIDQDDYTAFYYGLKKSLQVAGFNKDKINIIILLGTCGDFIVDVGRKEAAQSKNHEALVVDKKRIYENLSELDAHLYSMQLHNDGRRYTGIAYAVQSQKIILETAKYIYTKSMGKANSQMIRDSLKEKKNFNYGEPFMALPIGVESVKMEGSKPGNIILPLKSNSLNTAKILSGINEMVNVSLIYEKILKEIFDKSYNEGGEIEIPKLNDDGVLKVPGASDGVLRMVEKIMEKSGVSIGEVLISTGMKLSLYTEVYLPLKAKGATHSMYSYVLFMPEADLLEYQNLIKRSLSSANVGSYPEKRKALFEVYMGLIEQFAGQDYLKNKKAEDMTRQEVLEIMQGIESEGLELNLDLNVRIGGIRNEKEVPNEQIDALIQRFNDVNANLENIIKLNNRFDFCLTSDNSNRYYWLRLDEVF